MSDQESPRAGELHKLRRRLQRAEERLASYERTVDRTQHLLNTRIRELEAARRELAVKAEELELSQQRFRQLSEAAFEAIVTHRDGRLVDCNQAAEGLYQLRRDQLLGSDLLDRVHASYRDRAGEWIAGPTSTPVEAAHLRADGSRVPVELRTRRTSYHGSPALVTVVRDITEHKQLQEKLTRMANSDPLTGIGNRRFFFDAGSREFFRSERYHHPLSVLIIDVDHFKRINDRYGHDAGDRALIALAGTAGGVLRDSDVLARIGGEEFAAVLPHGDAAGARTFAERLRRAVAAIVLQDDATPIRFTVSVGIATKGAEDHAIESILSRADAALYRAKQGGRNRVEFAQT